MTSRRSFMSLLGGAAAFPLEARAQPPAIPVIGFLSVSSPGDRTHIVNAFRRGIRETGFVEGQTVAIDFRWAQNQHERLPELAAELVQRQVAVIAAADTRAALAAKSATTTLPIVFAGGIDPVREGLVASLNRPGSNVTGVTFLAGELGAKQLGLLRELVPKATRIGVLIDPTWPVTEQFLADVRAAASAIGTPLEVRSASSGSDILAAFAGFSEQRIDALVVGPSALTNSRRVQLVTLAAYHRVPAIHTFREAAEAGALMSYGASITEAHRQAGIYVGRILKGQKPADLPVIQSAKFEFVLNLDTAKAFGLSVPAGLLAIADEVIE